jgi:hypothetical protein
MNVANSAFSPQLAASVADLAGYPYTQNYHENFSPKQVGDRANTIPFARRLGPGGTFQIIEDGLDCLDPGEDEVSLDDLKSDFNERFGTYMVHGELLFVVSEFSESPYAKPMPWNDSYNSNFNIELKPLGLYRSFFNYGTAGNYQNFYNMCPISESTPYFEKSRIPQFYSSEGQCTETTFSPNRDNRIYEEYKPFIVENRGYSRSYFYGMNR